MRAGFRAVVVGIASIRRLGQSVIVARADCKAAAGRLFGGVAVGGLDCFAVAARFIRLGKIAKLSKSSIEKSRRTIFAANSLSPNQAALTVK